MKIAVRPKIVVNDPDYFPDTNQALAYLGDRHLMATPVRRIDREDDTGAIEMNITMPVGYSLLKDGVDGQHIYNFQRPDGTKGEEWFTWKMGCVDAMWTDVRAIATKLMVPGPGNTERDLRATVAFSRGYLEGKRFADTQVRLTMARSGYVFDPEITALQTVEKLLVMLNGARV